MTLVDYIAQPDYRTTLDAIGDIAESEEIEMMDVAAAYITSGGAVDLTKKIKAFMGGRGIASRNDGLHHLTIAARSLWHLKLSCPSHLHLYAYMMRPSA